VPDISWQLADWLGVAVEAFVSGLAPCLVEASRLHL